MSQTDTLQRFLIEDSAVRGEIVHLDDTWQAVLEKRHYPTPIRHTLGQFMAAAALLSATLKFQGSLIMQIRGSGPINLLVVECTSGGAMRATAQWKGEPDTEDLSKLFGDGQLVITIDPKLGKERYQGIVELKATTVAAALEDYLMQSEQLATRLWLAADQHQACGMLLQKLPQEVETEESDDWNRAIQLAETLTDEELLMLSPSEIIRRLYHEETIRLFASEPMSFSCSCSRDRVVNALRVMGPDDLNTLIKEHGSVSVDCEFCNQHYEFDAVDVEQIFASANPTDAPPTRQ
jgi:molecular chaperone Hsp33